MPGAQDKVELGGAKSNAESMQHADHRVEGAKNGEYPSPSDGSPLEHARSAALKAGANGWSGRRPDRGRPFGVQRRR